MENDQETPTDDLVRSPSIYIYHLTGWVVSTLLLSSEQFLVDFPWSRCLFDLELFNACLSAEEYIYICMIICYKKSVSAIFVLLLLILHIRKKEGWTMQLVLILELQGKPSWFQLILFGFEFHFQQDVIDNEDVCLVTRFNSLIVKQFPPWL